jgi:dynein assembly factor 3, axonemal
MYANLIQFYVMESQASALARHMLLLGILLDQSRDVGVQETTELFLECYGNLMVREKTAVWIKEHASALIRYANFTQCRHGRRN